MKADACAQSGTGMLIQQAFGISKRTRGCERERVMRRQSAKLWVKQVRYHWMLTSSTLIGSPDFILAIDITLYKSVR